MVNLSAERLRLLPPLLMRVAQEEGCENIEVRGGIGCEAMADADSCVKHPLHYYAVLNLGESEQLWRKSLTNEARKGVNRGQKAGLTAEVRRNAAAVEDPFYDLYLISMKRLGVPPHPQSFFVKLSAGLGDRLVGGWVTSKAEPVAVLLGAIADSIPRSKYTPRLASP